MAQDLAQGLASLGRNNDSMLVHMTPREVQGLQSLAMAHGGSLTINPHTGLPEAGFLDAVLPMVGGAALSPFMGPMAAGLLIGGVTALTSGDIGKGLMAGLGGFGGADLGKIFTKMGTAGGIPVGAGSEAVKAGIAEALPAGAAQNISMFTPAGTFGNQTMNAALTGAGVGSSAIPSSIASSTMGPGVNSAVNAMGAAPTSAQVAQSTLGAPVASSSYSDMGKGFGNLISNPSEGFEAFKIAGGEAGKPLTTGEAAVKLGSPVASIALSGMEPPTYEGYEDPDKGKWRSTSGGLSLSDKFDTGLRLAEGGTITTGGIRDLYGNTDDQLRSNISEDGYGLGRLNTLASEQSMTKAQGLGYADGGGVVAGDRGMNLNELPTLNVNTGEQIPAGGLSGLNSGNPMIDALFAKRISGGSAGMIDNPLYMYGQILKDKGVRFAAKGGYLDGAGDGMSDSIPATIEGKQPARLADGEFVVPADVVSHLGNGSSKAGSKRLYAMLDKVRHARTGTKKQGKEINPEKYMPA